MGIVYEAEQISLKRRVALKVLSTQYGLSQEAVQKFQREAEAGGRQSHPGIVSVIAVGEDEGFHYIAQELVEGGRTLADELEELGKKDDPPMGYFRQMAKQIVEVAEALAHAHSSGVIHRDIKPSNILLTKEGSCKVSDFGLAKVEDALALSRAGDLAGTPYYMSPEQVRGGRGGIDARTDIYSLGVTLYEMLTFRKPFEGETSYEVLKKIPVSDPMDPQKAHSRVPRDLAVICLKAMEKEPSKRYPTMREFAEDLRLFLSGEVILAKPGGAVTKLLKRAKRYPALSASLCIALVALAALVFSIPWYVIQITREKDRVLRLADVKVLSQLLEEEKDLWPAYPEKATEMEAWLERAQALVDRLEIHTRTLDTLRTNALHNEGKTYLSDREDYSKSMLSKELKKERNEIAGRIAELELREALADSGTAGDDKYKESLETLKINLSKLEEQINLIENDLVEKYTWIFSDNETQWQHDTLQELVAGLLSISDEEKGIIKKVKDRLFFATTIEEITCEKHREAWDRAIASIADMEECPQYKGMVIKSQLGMVPIGRDTESGLWEFAHLQTGEIPERSADGKLKLTEKTGLVFVLIPVGSFNMGVVPPSDENPIGSPNVVPWARTFDGPVHAVTLKPFFLSKYEMNQGQWLRFTGNNPSGLRPNTNKTFLAYTLLHPVENVSWEDCVQTLSRLNLRLPSESEWEYAARAGTTTPWYTGNNKESLEGHVNLIDLTCQEWDLQGPGWPYEEWIEDGYGKHAPSGSFKSNALGLHDVYGNVAEWCQDTGSRYGRAPRDGSAHEKRATYRILRGGGFLDRALRMCSSGIRNAELPFKRMYDVGLRPAASVK
jgi:formylglycine-generating enzyme required for sulfatase activity/serine/threonine protein kinase